MLCSNCNAIDIIGGIDIISLNWVAGMGIGHKANAVVFAAHENLWLSGKSCTHNKMHNNDCICTYIRSTSLLLFIYLVGTRRMCFLCVFSG